MTGPITHSLFHLGQVYLTPDTLDYFEQAEEAPLAYMQRHVPGDFNDLATFDYEQNVLALPQKANVFSV
jgi:hypothetical protein